MRLRRLMKAHPVKAYPAGVGVVILALAATVFALGATAQRPSIIDGASWLWSSDVGEAAQVNAVSRLVALRQPMIDAQGHPVQVSQSDQYVILHDLTTGRVTSIDLTRLGFSGSLDLGVTEDTAVLLNGPSAILVDRTRGVVRPIDPATLQASGEQLRLPAPLVGGAFDKSGRLWMSIPSQGTAIALTVHDGRLTVDRTEAVTTPGHPQALSVLDDGALVVDRGGDTITVVDGQGARKITTAVPLTSAIVPPRTVGAMAAITLPAERTVLAIGDTTAGTALTTLPMSSPQGDPATQKPAVCFANRVYVPSEATGTVRVFTATGQPAGTIEVGGPTTVVELEVREDYLFINAPATEKAVMVDGDGKATTVDKYDPDQHLTPTPTPPAAPTPTPTATHPTPKPTPKPSPKPTPTKPPVQVQPQAPGPPVPVTALAGDGEVRVSWGRSRAGSAPVSAYTVTWEESGGGQVRVNGDTLQATIPGLTNGTTYEFRVFATNSVGNGPSAVSTRVTPRAAAPPATPAAPTATKEVNGAGLTNGTVIVTWPTVPDATDYVVTPLRAGVAGAHPPQVVPGGSARFVGLLGGFTYTFTVVARNAAGLASAASPPSNEIFAHFPPGPPKGVTGRQTGANTYVISWTEAYPNGTPITSYVVRNPAGATLATVSGDSRGATVTATGLAEVRVSATNGDGEGPAGSGPVTVTTYGAQVTCTDSPSNPQPNFCAAGLPVYFAANDDGAVSRRVANGQRINVVCRAYGEDQDAGPYNNFKHGGHWLRFTDGTYISRVWLEIDNDDVVEAIPVC